MAKWRVVVKFWKANSGWTHDEDWETLDDYMDAETYTKNFDGVEGFFSDGEDAVQFEIRDEDNNTVSEFWLDREDAVDHWKVYHIGGEHDGEEIGYFEKETDAINFARNYCKEWDDEPDFMGVTILDRYGDEVINW